jgi:RimJ/RimL family protein N-acetyltransferase
VIPSLLKKRPSGPGWSCKPKGHLLATQHLTLRAPKPADFDSIREHLDDEVVYRLGFPTSDVELDRVAKDWARARLQRRPYYECWVVCERVSKEVVGVASVKAHTTDSAVCEMGLSLANGWRGRGLGSEVVAAIMSVLPHLGFDKANAGTRSDNETAIKLFTKFGFSRHKSGPHELPNGYVVPSIWLQTIVPKTSTPQCELRRLTQ